MSYEKKWSRMTTTLTAVSLLLTTPWYVVSLLDSLVDGPFHHDWSLMTSLLSSVVVVVHPVCFIAFSVRSQSGGWARRRLPRMSVCPSASMRQASLSGGDCPGTGRVPRTCRLHSAPECTIRSTLLGQTSSPIPLGLAPIQEHSTSQGRSTSGTSPVVHRMTPRVSSATPVDDASSPAASDRLQLSPAASPTDSGLCPTPLQQRPSPSNSPRSSPRKLERFFGEQLGGPPQHDVNITTSSSPRARSLSPRSAALIPLAETTPRDSRIVTTTHQQSTLSAPERHRPVDVHQLSYVACE